MLMVAVVGAALFLAGYLMPRDTTPDRDIVAGVEPVVASNQATDQGEPGSERESGEDTPLSGAAAERAKAAAQAAVPGATVQEVERDTDGASGTTYEVELAQPDGSTMKVHLDGSYRVVETAREGRDD
jgi:hypothetical protein